MYNLTLNDQEVHTKLKKLGKTAKEDAPKIAARKASRYAKKVFRRNMVQYDHVVTGTGVSSINEARVGKNHYVVRGRQYIDDVIKGKARPVIRHNRLRAWADKRGWKLDDIVEHLRTRGARPHPEFWNETRTRVRKTIKSRTEKNIKLILEMKL